MLIRKTFWKYLSNLLLQSPYYLSRKMFLWQDSFDFKSMWNFFKHLLKEFSIFHKGSSLANPHQESFVIFFRSFANSQIPVLILNKIFKTIFISLDITLFPTLVQYFSFSPLLMIFLKGMTEEGEEDLSFEMKSCENVKGLRRLVKLKEMRETLEDRR